MLPPLLTSKVNNFPYFNHQRPRMHAHDLVFITIRVLSGSLYVSGRMLYFLKNCLAQYKVVNNGHSGRHCPCFKSHCAWDSGSRRLHSIISQVSAANCLKCRRAKWNNEGGEGGTMLARTKGQGRVGKSYLCFQCSLGQRPGLKAARSRLTAPCVQSWPAGEIPTLRFHPELRVASDPNAIPPPAGG